jgi:TPP-dependent indolepyruvate ferredoxin oxidoreductase alpha subunit
MTLEADIAATRKRLAKARAARDTSKIEALALELARLEKMAHLGISFDGQQYRYGSRRYQQLGDAVKYARLQLGLPAADPQDPQ